MNTSAIARSTDLELAAWGHPCATLRIALVELSNLGRGDDRLPALWMPLGSKYGPIGGIALDPIGIVKGQALYEASQLHPAGSECPPGRLELTLGRELRQELSEWPPLGCPSPSSE